MHAAIEFGNRMLTFVLVAIAVATFVAAWQSRPPRPAPAGAGARAGIPAQAVIGGITVLTDLNPWIVSFHLLLLAGDRSGCRVVFLRRLDHPPGPRARGPLSALAWATFAAAWLVLYVGTVVTGSGPHAGDVDSPAQRPRPAPAQPAARRRGVPVRRPHRRPAASPSARRRRATAARPRSCCSASSVAQGAIGFVQYFTDLPVVLVGLHMLGAALISAA